MRELSLFTNDGSETVTSDRILYTASGFARSGLLHLQEIGSLTARRPHTSERVGLQSFLFFMVISGAGTLSYENKEFELQKNSCVFINCRKPYRHSTDPDHLWQLRWIHFDGPTLPIIYNKYCERGGRPAFIPEEGTIAELESVWMKLMEAAKSSDYLRDMRINQLLAGFMACIMSESWHPEERKPAPKRASVAEVKAYLDAHFAEHISLEDLSARFFIDKYYLTKTFRSQFGQTISAYLQSIRITRAKQLLRFTKKTVEEIGYETGIGSPAYFSRVFKNVEGISPKTYREQW